jgi:hypothetical protein
MSPRGGRRAVHEERLTRHGSKRIAPASGQHRLENGAAAQAEIGVTIRQVKRL